MSVEKIKASMKCLQETIVRDLGFKKDMQAKGILLYRVAGLEGRHKRNMGLYNNLNEQLFEEMANEEVEK